MIHNKILWTIFITFIITAIAFYFIYESNPYSVDVKEILEKNFVTTNEEAVSASGGDLVQMLSDMNLALQDELDQCNAELKSQSFNKYVTIFSIVFVFLALLFRRYTNDSVNK